MSLGLICATLSTGATAFASELPKQIDYVNTVSVSANEQDAIMDSSSRGTFGFDFAVNPGQSVWGTNGQKNDYTSYSNVKVTYAMNSIPMYYRVTSQPNVDSFIGETKNVTGPYTFNLNYYDGEAYPRSTTLRAYISSAQTASAFQSGQINF